MEKETVKRKELVWKNVTKNILDVLYPLIQITNTIQSPLLPTPQPDVSIKELNTCSTSHPENVSTGLDYAIKAYAQRHLS